MLVTSYLGLIAFDALLAAGSLFIFAGWKEEKFTTEAEKRAASAPYIMWAKRAGYAAVALYLLSALIGGA